MDRIREYFTGNENSYPDRCISNVPPKLYRQERDWSCSIACLRSLLSARGTELTEEKLIGMYGMTPGPHYSKDMKGVPLPGDPEVIWGCDEPDITIRRLFEYMSEGYYIMAETMYNYAHWYVLLGYNVLDGESNPERHYITAYDPYYNEIRVLNADEFDSMWLDGDHAVNGIKRDFVALR